MAKFNFRYSSIKKIKENFEKKSQKELAQIDLFIRQQKELRTNLIAEINSLRNENMRKRVCASELIFKSGYKNSMQKKIESVDSEIENLNKQRTEKLVEVLQKSKEKKILSNLESIHLENFQLESTQAETKALDEIAVQKFLRNNK